MTPPTAAGGPGDIAPVPVWREPEWLVLALLVLAIYFTRLTDLTIRGEEPRWARVAQEMIDTGDWIVPRLQGDPFPDRPPLNSWAMIAASRLTGQLDLVAIRLPTVTATLLVTLLIYGYGRCFLSRLGAFAAAAAYPTMAQVLQLGRLAESDSLLTLCTSAALFSWHYAYARRGDARLAWVAGYALAALAGLAKGPQGPVYFVLITVIFLALHRDWRFLFNRWHAAGCGVFLLVVGAWQVPFYLALDPASAQAVWTEGGDVSRRFDYGNLGQVLRAWGSYPFEVLACTMPWSFMLLMLPTRWFRQSMGKARPLILFLTTACAVAFPTCWLPADSRARYFMSLYPSLALLVGAGIERCWQSPRSTWWQRSWDRYLLLAPLPILGAALFVGIATIGGGARMAKLSDSVSVGFVVLYGTAAVAATAVIVWSRHKSTPLCGELGVLTLAGFLGLTYSGIVLSAQMGGSNDPSADVIAVRRMIPRGERLLSFGLVHHLFAYYYQEPIELRKLTDTQAPSDFSNTYFCFVDDPGFETPEIPFEWERVAEISCERARSNNPLTKVVIGTRSRTAHAPPRLDRLDGSDQSEGFPVQPVSANFPDVPAGDSTSGIQHNTFK
jgi:4-amino-4-deoxy-L-arabinose transferase-like glycosyltransferase